MDLKEQLKKVTEDLEKLERKKEKFLADYDEKRKKILTKKKELENKIQREQEEKYYVPFKTASEKLMKKILILSWIFWKKTVRNFRWRWKLH